MSTIPFIIANQIITAQVSLGTATKSHAKSARHNILPGKFPWWSHEHAYTHTHPCTQIWTVCGCTPSCFSLRCPAAGTLSNCFECSAINLCIIALPLPYYSVHYLCLSLATASVILTTTPEYLCKQTNCGGELACVVVQLPNKYVSVLQPGHIMQAKVMRFVLWYDSD